MVLDLFFKGFSQVGGGCGGCLVMRCSFFLFFGFEMVELGGF